jgi:hypothetical protein
MQKDDCFMKINFLVGLLLLCTLRLSAQDATAPDSDVDVTHAGHVPVISGGMGYIQNRNASVTTLLPQINPILLVPFGSHVLGEARVDFTGFFERRNGTGDFTGQIFKTTEFAQIDWLANTHAIVVGGKYLLPFGLYNERLSPIWIRNLQDQPLTGNIGTETTGGGVGGMLRGVIAQTDNFSVQYSTYYSAHSSVNQLDSARTTGFDASVYFPKYRVEVGSSYQRFLEGHHSNSEAAYLSWQPKQLPLDLKAEYDRSFTGQGYWIEGAYMLSQIPTFNRFFRNLQFVARADQSHPLHGGGNGVPGQNTKRPEFGLNYYIHDNLRLISSYGRQFTSSQDSNQWNFGFTYRFMWPLWPGKK